MYVLKLLIMYFIAILCRRNDFSTWLSCIVGRDYHNKYRITRIIV